MGKEYNLLSKQASKQAKHSCALSYPHYYFTYTEMAEPVKRHGYSHVS